MPIEKKPASILRKEDKPYEAISRSTVQQIHSADALAIWVYLQCKPQDWTIRKKDIMTSLDIGKVRYAKAMNVLQDLGLITYSAVKGDGGRFRGQTMWCNAECTEIASNGVLHNRCAP